MLQRLVNSISYRKKRLDLGLYSLLGDKSTAPKIQGRRVQLRFPDNEDQVQIHEFGKIFFEDCYKLRTFKGPIRNILDIWANIGLFSLASRHLFSKAKIHCCEPNPTLLPFLRANLEFANVVIKPDAIGTEPGFVDICFGENSLHTITKPKATGRTRQVTLAEALRRLGGNCDLLKLDCEGAEWGLFQNKKPWRHVRCLTMEYHSWAGPNLRIEDLIFTLRELGFQITAHEPSPRKSFGMLQASKI